MSYDSTLVKPTVEAENSKTTFGLKKNCDRT